MITSLIPSFNAGELSPLMHLRSDLEKYRAGCRTLENMHIIPFGGVRRRSGFTFVRESLSQSRLFRFQVSTSEGYVLELGSDRMRIFSSDGSLVAVRHDPAGYELVTSYDDGDLPEVQSVQINHVAYFTHPGHPVMKLWREANESGNMEWKFSKVDFDYPPMQDENLRKGYKIEVKSGGDDDPNWDGGVKGEIVKLHTVDQIFDKGDRDAYFEISHPRRADQFDVTVSARESAATEEDIKAGRADTLGGGIWSSVLYVQGGWTFTTSGTWRGTFVVQRSAVGRDNWVPLRTFKGNKNANFSAGGEEENLVKMRVKWIPHKDADKHEFNPKGTLEASGAFIRGLVKVTETISRNKVLAKVILPVMNGETSYWRQSAWSRARGYPRTVCAHEGRLIFGGNAWQPQAVWASAVDDYEFFKPGGTEDDDSWTHVIASDQQNSIQWMISQKSLLIGTSGDEWVLGSSQDETIITPTSVRARRHSGCGSKFIKARLVDDSVIFVQRGGRKVRDMTFSFNSDGYVTTDLTLLAEHITGGGEGIKDTALQVHPEPRLWCVTSAGELLVLTYDRGQSLTGWQRMTTGSEADGFESVAILSTTGQEDQIWVTVRRRIDNVTRRYVERMNSSGVFLATPWSEYLPGMGGIQQWSDLYRTYKLGDIVYDPANPNPGFAFYYCVLTHTEQPGTSLVDTVRWRPVKLWTPGMTVIAGEYVYKDGGVFKCLVTNNGTI